MDDLTEYLLQDRQHVKISPEMLELLGKQAANQFLDEGVSLNEGVAKLAGVYPDINSDQIKRICEFANTAVHLAYHDKNKTAGAGSSYPQFELADAGRVVQDLTDGARPTHITQVDVAYGKQPLKPKLASAQSDALLAAMFESGAVQDLPFTKTSAINDIADLKDELVAQKEHLESSGQQFDSLQKEASENYYQVVKAHLMEGGSFGDVYRAALEVVPAKEKLAKALTPFVSRLLREGVSKVAEVGEGLDSMAKLASRRVDPGHPLVSLFGAVVSFNTEMDKVAVALEEIDLGLGKVNSFLKEQLSAGAAR